MRCSPKKSINPLCSTRHHTTGAVIYGRVNIGDYELNRLNNPAMGASLTLLLGLTSLLPVGCVSDSDIIRSSYEAAAVRAQERSTVKVPGVLAFVCSYWEDINNNKQMEHPDEFIKIGWVFTDNEPVTLCLGTRIKRAFERTIIITDSIGDVVFEERKAIDASPLGQMGLIPVEAGGIPIGEYTAIWRVDGVEVATMGFEIVEAPEVEAPDAPVEVAPVKPVTPEAETTTPEPMDNSDADNSESEDLDDDFGDEFDVE